MKFVYELDEEATEYEGYDVQKLVAYDVHGKKLWEHSDGGEPEDMTFNRNLGWIKPALERAYAEGYARGFATVAIGS